MNKTSFNAREAAPQDASWCRVRGAKGGGGEGEEEEEGGDVAARYKKVRMSNRKSFHLTKIQEIAAASVQKQADEKVLIFHAISFTQR